MNKQFIEACKKPEFRQKASKYGKIVEKGITWCDDVVIYWFDVEKTTLSLAYDVTKGEYI